MAKTTHTITTNNSSTAIVTATRPAGNQYYECMIFVYGTWGSGTIAWMLSPDGGTTKLPIKDLTNVAITSTANDSFTFRLPMGRDFEEITLYASLTGATSPSLTVLTFDNR